MLTGPIGHTCRTPIRENKRLGRERSMRAGEKSVKGERNQLEEDLREEEQEILTNMAGK